MTLRSSRMLAAVVLLGSLAALPACKKKTPDGGTGGGDPGPGPNAPSAVSSEHVLFAHLKTKDILDSALFAEVKKAFAKEGGNVWDMAEQEVAKNLGGIKPTDIDSVSVFVTEVPERDMPKFVLILAANKPMNKSGVFGLGPQAKPDARGFYVARENQGLIHFPDDKTLVALHPDLADKYLAGYAKNRAGWPMTSDLKTAAAGHTLFAVVDVSKIPGKMLGGQEAQQFAPLLKAQRLTLTADLKGKEISAAVRATFPNADDATKAKETVQGLVGMASSMVDQFASGKGAADLGGFMPAVKEAQRALKAIKIEVSGSDLTVAGNYKIDFDIGAMMTDAAKKVQEAAARMQDSNNLKQIGIALHAYHDTTGSVVIHGAGPGGKPLANATQKPLLSWRVAILPYVEQENLYKQFKLDEPWDSEHNKKLIPQMPKLFAPAKKPVKPGYTHLQMVVGPNAMQLPSESLLRITDGTSNTIAVVEAAEPVVWTKPDDVMLPGKDLPKDLKKKFGGLHPNGFNVLLWDGSVRFVSNSISERTLGLLLNPRDGQPIPGDW